jgi:glyoxylase-like metal-dependent hydrolase (beta-lactamase superfamily II)
MVASPAPLRSIDIGAIKITYLPDGVAHFALGVFPGTSNECWARHAEQTSDGRWLCSIGSFLIESKDEKILVDLGFGETELEIPDFVTAHSGHLLDSLSQTGVKPDEITTVVYTHMHADHTGWTVTGDHLTFDRARHLAGPGEVMYWSAHAEAPFSPAAQLAFAARFDESRDGQELAPGVNIMQTPGHTPGHQCVVVSSGDDRAIILGDAIHCSAQLEEPDMTFMYDVDPVRARQWREELLTQLENSTTRVGACHFSGSAFGRVLVGHGRRYWSPLGSYGS